MTGDEAFALSLPRTDGSRITKVENRIDALENASDVVDVVADKTALDNYDTSTLTDKDVIKIIDDATHDNTPSYYRFDKASASFSYIASVAPYYSKTQADTLHDTLQDNIDAEATTRQTNDTTLQDNIDNEATARQTADDTLQGNIDALEIKHDNDIKDLQTDADAKITALETKHDAFETAQAAKDTAQDTSITTLQTDLQTEITARTTADTILQDNIDAEATTRQTNDTTLQDNIDALETDVTTKLNGKVSKSGDTMTGDLTAPNITATDKVKGRRLEISNVEDDDSVIYIENLKTTTDSSNAGYGIIIDGETYGGSGILSTGISNTSFGQEMNGTSVNGEGVQIKGKTNSITKNDVKIINRNDSGGVYIREKNTLIKNGFLSIKSTQSKTETTSTSYGVAIEGNSNNNYGVSITGATMTNRGVYISGNSDSLYGVVITGDITNPENDLIPCVYIKNYSGECEVKLNKHYLQMHGKYTSLKSTQSETAATSTNYGVELEGKSFNHAGIRAFGLATQQEGLQLVGQSRAAKGITLSGAGDINNPTNSTVDVRIGGVNHSIEIRRDGIYIDNVKRY